MTGTSEVIYKAQDVETPLVVVAGEGPTIFMLKGLQLIQLDWNDIQYMTTAIDKLQQNMKPF